MKNFIFKLRETTLVSLNTAHIRSVVSDSGGVTFGFSSGQTVRYIPDDFEKPEMYTYFRTHLDIFFTNHDS